MNTIKKLILVLFAGIIVVSCNNVENLKTPGGMPYQLYAGKDTQKIYAGNIMKLSISQKIKDSVYFTTAGKLPIYMQVNPTSNPYDISEIWTKLHRGDSVVAVQMMDTFINRMPQNIPPEFKKGDRIITNVKIIGVFTSDSIAKVDEKKGKDAWLASEIAVVEKYLKEKNIVAQKTKSGAFVQTINPGTGNLIDSGNYVSVNYTGVSFSGVTFDSNTDTSFHHAEPYPFTAGAGVMSKGFDEAILLMKNGGSAKFYVPSMLAYGPSPNSPLIKPFEHLIFDVAIVDVKKAAPAPPVSSMPKQPLRRN